MESVIRAAVIYLVLLLIFRIAGKRALSDTTTFDLVMLLIISEAVQEALIDNDSSMTNAFLLVITLVGLDVVISLLKRYSKKFDRLIEGAPLVLVADGKPLSDRLRKERVGEDEVLEAARLHQGIGAMKDIQYAVLERNGVITIIPRGA